MLVLENDLQSPPLRGLVGDEILFKSSVAVAGCEPVKNSQKMLFAQNSLLWTHAILHLSSLDFAEKGNFLNMAKTRVKYFFEMNFQFLFTLVNNNSSGNREINLEIEIYLVCLLVSVSQSGDLFYMTMNSVSC